MTTPNKIREVTWEQVRQYADNVARIILSTFPGFKKGDRVVRVCGVPRGGVYAALAVQASFNSLRADPELQMTLCQDPRNVDFFVDDIIDSGKTKKDFFTTFGDVPFYGLVDKPERRTTDWFQFPWELSQKEEGPENNITRILQYIGEDVNRDGLQETPKRVVESYKELFGGYAVDLPSIIKTFESSCDEMVVLKSIEFFSTCEHHMLPFLGKAHIAYIPNGKIIGISKLARILEVYSRRLQIQERIAEQVTKALDLYLSPKGSACVLEASHLCMTCRGVGKQNSVMVSSSLTGVFRDKLEARQEFFSILR